MTTAVITGVGLYLPLGMTPEELLDAALAEDQVRLTTEVAPHDTSALPGYPGQDAPTALAIGAAKSAGLTPDQPGGNHFGVLVASTTSNIDTVARTAAGIAQESYRAVRPSEVLTIAGTHVTASLSSWFDARAFAYSSCAGAAAGLDAMALARAAIRRERAQRVLIVGVETPGDEARRMITEAHGGRSFFSGAAAVVVERTTDTQSPETVRVHAISQTQTIPDALTHDGRPSPDLVFLPAGTETERRDAAEKIAERYRGAQLADLTRLLGDTQGALGVLQLALAATWLQRKSEGKVLVLAGSISDHHLVTTVLDKGWTA